MQKGINIEARMSFSSLKRGREKGSVVRKPVYYPSPRPTRFSPPSLLLLPPSSFHLLLPKPHRLLHRQTQFILQRLKRLIRRQIEAIKASMTLWQLIMFARLLDRESSRAIRALQILEPVDRNTRGAGRKLEETRFLLRVPGADALVVLAGARGEGGIQFTFQKFWMTSSVSV